MRVRRATVPGTSKNAFQGCNSLLRISDRQLVCQIDTEQGIDATQVDQSVQTFGRIGGFRPIAVDLVAAAFNQCGILIVLFSKDPTVEPLREMVGRRLLPAKGIEEAQRDLNRMLITLWSAGYLELDPKPIAAAPKSVRKASEANEPAKTEGLFGGLLDQMRTPETAPTDAAEEDNQDPALIESRGYEVDSYRPETANPTERLDRLVHLRSINPLFGVYLADQLAIADPQERIAALESVLEVPGTVARLARMPSLDEMPAGTLATSRLDPQLLQLGLATAEELGAKSEDEEEEVVDRGFGRVMFQEPRVWPLTIGEKILRLFRHEFPRVHDINIRPVWIVGELMEFGGDFNNTSRLASCKKKKEFCSATACG